MKYTKKLNIIIIATAIVLLLPSRAEAYIGPGAGIALVGSVFVLFIAMLSAIAALFTWPIRLLIRSVKYRKAFAKSRIKKFVILGLDGMDPKLAKKYLEEGKLPNLARLSQKGCFKPLRTTIPSISPVAWSTFQTGTNPGKHNIFDFLTRDKHSYKPRLSSVDIFPPRRKISIGKYQIPLSKADIRLLRKGRPFWKILGENGMFSNVIRVPITFPPEKFRGTLLSGMCVPDILGTQGTFSYFTTKTSPDSEQIGGQQYPVEIKDNIIKAGLIGPANAICPDNGILKCPFTVQIKNQDSVKLKINGQTYPLVKDQYTEWITVDFKAGLGIKISGICKFLLLSTEPEFELYVTPININPAKPAMPISHPPVYSTYLAKKQGSFATLGLAEDSWALNEKVLIDDGFIQQCIQTDLEREQMFFDSLDKVENGLCVCVFDGTDRIQHTFWRDIDELHPARSDSSEQRNAIEELYVRMDELVGKTMKKCEQDNTVLMVISDHGFNTFRHGIDLNRWLEENGYMKVMNDREGIKYLEAIDWSQTKAFAIGLTGMFLNLKGRESQGIVDPGQEAEQLREEISQKLTELTDPNQENKKVIKHIYNALKVYKGPYKTEAPDLIVGYDLGYRASWQTAVGEVTDTVFHDNKKAWSGDHCIDPSLVPGVLFCNRQISSENPGLIDIGPTVLEMFGISVPKNMDGKPLGIADSKADISNNEKS